MSSNNNQNGKGNGMTDDWRLNVNLGTVVNVDDMVEAGQSGGGVEDFSTGGISEAQKDILALLDAKLKHVSRLESKLQHMDVLEAKIHELERRLELTNKDSGLKDSALDPPLEEDSDNMDREGCSNEDTLIADAQEEQFAPQTIRGHLKVKASKAKELVKTKTENFWEEHRTSTISQVQSMDLAEKFDYKAAYVIALILYLAKTAYVVSFSVYHQGKCTPSTAVIDADKDPEWFENMYSEKNHQHICSTCSLDSHRCNKKAQQWIQLYDNDFGMVDPQEYMDLTQEGYPYMWTGKDAMLWATEAPLKDAATAEDIEDGMNEKTGWVLFNNVVFVHECADKCSSIGGGIGFWALDYVTEKAQCWCSTHTLAESSVCQVMYDIDFQDPNVSHVSQSFLLEELRDDYTQGFSGEEIASFEEKFDFLRMEAFSRQGCRYDQKTLATFMGNTTGTTGWYSWNNSLFSSVPSIVFSKEPAICVPRCNATGLDQMCNVDVSDELVSKRTGLIAGVMTNETMTEEERSVFFMRSDPFHNFVQETDFGLSEDYWNHCSLKGFSCANYQHDQCGQYREDDKKYCGEENFWEEDDAVEYDGYERDCFGVPSITYITCPAPTLTIGSAMGYMGFLELILVAIIAALVLFGQGRKAEALSVLTGALKTSTSQILAKAVEAAKKEMRGDSKPDPVAEEEEKLMADVNKQVRISRAVWYNQSLGFMSLFILLTTMFPVQC